MEAVARHAKVSKVTVYARYANRQSLLDAVVQHCARDLSAALDMAPASRLGVREALVGFGERLLGFIHSEDCWRLVRALASQQGLTEAEAAAMYQQGPQSTLQRLAAWMRVIHEAGLAHFPHPDSEAEQLLGMWIGFDMVRVVYGLPPHREADAVRRHVQCVVDAFLQIHEPRPIMP
jgi:TetR/AcrR family transcriptional repressor of mexJK operon